MARKVLVIHPNAGHYARGLAEACPEAMVVPLSEERLGVRVLPEEAHRHLADADAIVSMGRWIAPEVVDECRQLAWFQCLITGTDHLTEALSGRDVILTNARGIHGPQMSELAVLNMLVHMREVPRLIANQAACNWERVRPRILKGRTVVILGVGAIAGDLARLCKALSMTTVGVSRTPRAVAGFDRIEPRERMLAAVSDADFVVCLLPLTPENRGSIGGDVFRAMKPEAGFINISRGGVVDEEALIEALGARRVAFAGLDVFQTTPLPAGSPFWAMDNVFITPMIGGQSDQYDDDALPIVATNLKAFIAGRRDEMINRVAL